MSSPGDGLRLAIVGCGRMGGDRARAAVELGARIVAVCDPETSRAQELAARTPGAAVVDRFDQLEWSGLDAVFVCSPPFARGPVELAAVEAGVPFFAEKPVGLSADQAAPVASALREHRVLSAVGYMNRYRDSVECARRELADRPILGATCNWVGKPYKVAWWRDRELSGGPLNEQLTHLVDTTRYLLGEISEVQGIVRAPDDAGGVVETAAFSLRLIDGPLCSMFYSCAATTKMIDFQVFARDGRVRLAGWGFELVDDPTDRPAPQGDVGKAAIFRREVGAFLDAVASGSAQPIRCDFDDALATQRVVDALCLAAETGKPERVLVAG